MQCGREDITLWAMGDLFPDRIESSYELLAKGATDIYDRDDFESLVDRMDVPPERKFSGFDAYQKVIDSGVDMVILACSPHFRPKHLRAAIETGKHVFMEKPVAVDPAGVRSVIATSKLAEEKGLSIVAGTQRRHDPAYIEIMRRIHRGDIGELVGGQVYFMFPNPPGYLHPRQPGWSDDIIVESCVHGVDVLHWAFGTHPEKVLAMGGRQARTAPQVGNTYDHFAAEYEFANGVRVLAMSQNIDGATLRFQERIVGTKGVAHCDTKLTGPNAYEYDGPIVNPYNQEHADLIDAIRSGTPINEGRQVAESTLTGIMGRLSAYTGRALQWDWIMNASKQDLSLPEYKFGPHPVDPIAIPGKTNLV
jgi:predicted dehydrogenase